MYDKSKIFHLYYSRSYYLKGYINYNNIRRSLDYLKRHEEAYQMNDKSQKDQNIIL